MLASTAAAAAASWVVLLIAHPWCADPAFVDLRGFLVSFVATAPGLRPYLTNQSTVSMIPQRRDYNELVETPPFSPGAGPFLHSFGTRAPTRPSAFSETGVLCLQELVYLVPGTCSCADAVGVWEVARSCLLRAAWFQMRSFRIGFFCVTCSGLSRRWKGFCVTCSGRTLRMTPE